jgi:hypothetical protein
MSEAEHPHPVAVDVNNPPSTVPIVEPGPSPQTRWFRKGVENAIDELRLYRDTLWGMFRRPRELMREWTRGEVRALNPFAFLATTLAVASVSRLLAALHGSEPERRATLPAFLSRS